MMTGLAASQTGVDPVALLFERHQAELFAYLCRMLHNRQWAEDLTQETFLKALNARTHLPEVENHRAWLYRIATNLALDALRRRQRFTWLHFQDPAGQDDADPPGQDGVEAALAALPPAYRAPLILYSHYGLSIAEVGQALNLSQAAVKTRLFRARELFRQAYEKGGVQ